MSRTYEDALSHLASLQSNFAITSLFSPKVTAPDDSKGGNDKAQDLNAVAIPEVIAWLGRAGLTPDDLCGLRCVHVAGTKGKGSVCAYLTSVLTQPELRNVAGRVGTYTSPHLITVRERIMLDGEPIGRELFTRYFFEVWDAMTASARAEYVAATGQEQQQQISDEVEAELRGPATKPFYFRFLTIMALYAFLREGVRSAVIECGIGGEYDSTNILPPGAVTAGVVAQLGIDHVGMLGGTLPEIAWHKIGIAKAGRKIFTRKLEGGDAEEEAMKVIRARAVEKKAILVEVTDAQAEESSISAAHHTPSLAGEFQKYNRALVRAAVPEHLQLCDGEAYQSLTQETLEQAMRHGLEQAQLRGRCETRADGNITWLIDGAHTAESLHEVAKWFASKADADSDARKVLVFNQQERDVGKLLKVLCAGIPSGSRAAACPFDEAIFTRNDSHPRKEGEAERDLSVQGAAGDAYERIYPGGRTAIRDNITDTIEEVRKDGLGSQQKTLVLVTGSLHLIGALLQVLEPDAPR
ncbi:hypothetical protein PFICI_06295 [Pestalotiopsis fici W106-1]|uniref:Folylpolyglutamate synthase n=1 Tax=Pestalotiopsis fici (strain W106-1 / CGMCC3.15140) TaxID=1229662 RepID=W3X5B3_PESFW|nr:uncharacterized protein PFICI_06295 [Pestalotiopsis fici W106-1]ETS81293.1 hypothetical protein PFICI_06295 [Pestalotiopsis fici W106-1]